MFPVSVHGVVEPIPAIQWNIQYDAMLVEDDDGTGQREGGGGLNSCAGHSLSLAHWAARIKDEVGYNHGEKASQWIAQVSTVTLQAVTMYTLTTM